jgi:hypothetical protein
MGRKKTIRASKLPEGEKRVRIPEEADRFGEQLFRWRVNYNYIDLDHGEWGWGKLQIVDFFDILVNRLHNYETMTWHELLRRRSCHPMPISKIEPKARNRLYKKCEGIDTLHQIDIDRHCRLWGYKGGQFLYLIWHDPKHTVCLTRRR